MMEFLERLTCRFLVWRLRVGYGANCESCDLDEGHLGKELTCAAVSHPGRCASCRAAETIVFLKQHIDIV